MQEREGVVGARGIVTAHRGSLTLRKVRPQHVVRSLVALPQVAILLDVAASLAAFALAFWLRSTVPMPATRGLLPEEVFFRLKAFAGAFAGLQVLLFVLLRLHSFHRHEPWRDGAAKVAAAVFLQCLLLGGVLYALRVQTYPASVIYVYAVLDWFFCVLWRFLRKLSFLGGPTTLFIVGRPEATQRMRAKAIEGRWAAGERIVELDPSEPLGGARLLERVRQAPGSEVLLANGGMTDQEWVEAVSAVEGRVDGVYVSLSPTVAMLGGHRIRMLGDTPVLEAQGPLNDPVRRFVKRALDVAGSAALLVLAFPLGIVVGLLIRIFDGRPAFYIQIRTGLHGRKFRLIKFRTMQLDAEKGTGPVLSSKDDPRATPLGRILRRYRLDELPQLYNTLRGHMSLVGPRPERPELIGAHERNLPTYHLRHKVRPGLTGLAQIWGRYDTSAEDKLKLDLYYVYNHSLWLDFEILLQTITVLFTRPGK